jgi:hypothetical protein
MPRAKRKRDVHLWLVEARGLENKCWIVAGQSISSAIRKAERFFAQMAKEHGVSSYQISSVKGRGTIDVF